MERDFLQNLDLGDGARLPRSAIDAIMAEYGKTVQPLQRQITDLTRERDNLQTRADTAEGIVAQIPEGVDAAQVVQALATARSELEAERSGRAKDAADREYEDAFTKVFGKLKFSSPSAAAEVERKLRAAGLKLENGVIQGLEEKISEIREQDKAAFADEESAGSPARFTTPMSSGGEPMTREQILAIKDNKQRREAIAQNLNLFD